MKGIYFRVARCCFIQTDERPSTPPPPVSRLSRSDGPFGSISRYRIEGFVHSTNQIKQYSFPRRQNKRSCTSKLH